MLLLLLDGNKALMFKPIDYINVKPARKKNTESSLKTGCETLLHPVKYCTSYCLCIFKKLRHK